MTEKLIRREEANKPEALPGWEELHMLQDWHIVVLDQFAGMGHIRIGDELIAGATEMGCPQGSIHHLIVEDLLAGNFHGVGSSGFGKIATELIQNNISLQGIYRTVQERLVKKSDLEKVKQALLKEILGQEKRKAVVIVSHPDLATVMDDLKGQLENELGIKIYLVVNIPDHLLKQPHLPYYILNADLIVAPDDGSSQVAQEVLRIWWDKVHYFAPWLPVKIPLVEVVPHSVHPKLRVALTEQEYARRQAQVAPGGMSPMIAIDSMGGSAPQKDYYLKVIQGTQAFMEHHVVVKGVSANESFIQELQASNTNVITRSGNKELVSVYPDLYGELNPAITIVKPGELINHLQLLPSQRGGTILLFTAPVGNQEHQNESWAEHHYRIPSPREQMQAEKIILTGGSEQEIGDLLQKARGWRALRLPRDPDKAADFILNAKDLGVFSSMLEFSPRTSSDTIQPEIKDNGSFMFWKTLEDALNRELV